MHGRSRIKDRPSGRPVFNAFLAFVASVTHTRFSGRAGFFARRLASDEALLRGEKLQQPGELYALRL